MNEHIPIPPVPTVLRVPSVQHNGIQEDIKKIPEDIKKKIFNEYFKYDLEYEKLDNILKNINSIQLNNNDLVDYFEKNDILENSSFIEYLKKKDSIFKNIYNDHYIRNKITFALMDKLNSMCQCWLMFLYH